MTRPGYSGGEVRDALVSLGVSASEFGRIVGVTHGAVSKWCEVGLTRRSVIAALIVGEVRRSVVAANGADVRRRVRAIIGSYGAHPNFWQRGRMMVQILHVLYAQAPRRRSTYEG